MDEPRTKQWAGEGIYTFVMDGELVSVRTIGTVNLTGVDTSFGMQARQLDITATSVGPPFPADHGYREQAERLRLQRLANEQLAEINQQVAKIHRRVMDVVADWGWDTDGNFHVTKQQAVATWTGTFDKSTNTLTLEQLAEDRTPDQLAGFTITMVGLWAEAEEYRSDHPEAKTNEWLIALEDRFRRQAYADGYPEKLATGLPRWVLYWNSLPVRSVHEWRIMLGLGAEHSLRVEVDPSLGLVRMLRKPSATPIVDISVQKWLAEDDERRTWLESLIGAGLDRFTLESLQTIWEHRRLQGAEDRTPDQVAADYKTMRGTGGHS